MLGNISRNPIVAARDNDLTQQLARVLTEFPSIAGPDEYQGLMNARKRHVDSSVQKLETKSAEHQAALKTEFEVLKKQNKELVKQNSEMLKMLKGLRSKT